MRNTIISYVDMCKQAGSSLQRGMNFRLRGGYSVLLMSVRRNAPYKDRLEQNGEILIYEGHDILKTTKGPDPKTVDQPEVFLSGVLCENGKFHQAAQEFKWGVRPAEVVRVYEKIRQGIWSDNGHFSLVDSWREHDGNRDVFKFKLEAIDEIDESRGVEGALDQEEFRSRLIPTDVKLEVWKRDGGKCRVCGADDELHFDHIVPFSLGGTSRKVENVQLLCARHNLSKSAKIL